MRVAPKLCGCRVNMTYFIKNYKSLMTYFKMKGRYLGNTNLIVNVALAILTFFYRINFLCKSPFQQEKVQFNWKKSI